MLFPIEIVSTERKILRKYFYPVSRKIKVFFIVITFMQNQNFFRKNAGRPMAGKILVKTLTCREPGDRRCGLLFKPTNENMKF